MDICPYTLRYYSPNPTNKPSAHWKRTNTVLSCVSNMKEQRYATKRERHNRMRVRKNRRQCRNERENSDTDVKRQRQRAEEGCVRKFGSFYCVWMRSPQSVSLSLSDFDEAVPELISKPNSPRTQWLWFTLSLFTLTHTSPPLSSLLNTQWDTAGTHSCLYSEFNLWRRHLCIHVSSAAWLYLKCFHVCLF